jgi:precorrin-6Y C5,15-methyltransferase (decarboxylating)
MSIEPATAPWLFLIGIGEDGPDGLSSAAKSALAQAELIVGGTRHLALIGPTAQATLAWPSPLTDALPDILARRGRPVAVLASGDPYFHGIGTTLAACIAPLEIVSFPQVSSFQLAANRLGWAEQDCALVSLHGRALARLIPHLQPGAMILALSWDGSTPGKVAEILKARGAGDTTVTVLERLGGPFERIRSRSAAAFDLGDIDPLNTIAIHIPAGSLGRFLPLTAGRADDWFEHDGQITKRDVRAITLAALAPRRGELLWDIGAGSGSIAIEWMLAHPMNEAIAIEPRPERSARIGRNALSLGVPDLRIVEGDAPAALGGLATPNAVFIGGGATTPGVIETSLDALVPGGRLVINAVTLETQSLLLDWRDRIGGELVQIAVSAAEPLGGFTGWTPARPIVQWRVTKP